jgi:hypothetical protein
MKLRKYTCLVFAVAIVIGASGPPRLSAQAPRPAPLGRVGGTATKPTAPKQQSCAEQAGISKAVIDERRSIQENRRAEVEAVCMQSGLSEQQKMQQIREINQATQQKLAGMVTPAQEQDLKACNKARATSHPAGGAPHTGGPCAQFGH